MNYQLDNLTYRISLMEGVLRGEALAGV